MSLGFLAPAAALGFSAITLRPNIRGFYPPQQSAESRAKIGFAIVWQATVEESHTDEIEITDHPVEQGARISDHAYKKPSEVTITFLCSDSPIAQHNSILGNAVSTSSNILNTISPTVGAAGAINSTLQAAASLLNGNGISQSKYLYQKLLELQTLFIPFEVFTGKRAYKNMLLKSIAVTTNVKYENCLFVVATLREVNIVSTNVITTPINVTAQANKAATTPIQDNGVKQLKTGSALK